MRKLVLALALPLAAIGAEVSAPQEFCRVSKSFGHFNVRVR